MEPTRTPTQSSQTHGRGERFHQTIQNELYACAFRRKVDRALEAWPADVDEWLQTYHEHRTHSGT